MSDSRQADVDQVARLLEEVEQKGFVALPVLMAADLCALGAGSHAVVDDAVWRTWMGLDSPERDRLTRVALERLTQRELLDPPHSDDPVAAEDEIPFRVRAPLSIVLAARSQPTVIVTGRYADVESTVGPRAYGLGDTSQPVRAVILETVDSKRSGGRPRASQKPATPHGLDQLYLYGLATPAEAARPLASWAIAPTPSRGIRRRHLARSIDAYWHLEGQPPRCERLLTVGDGQRASVERIRPDGTQQPLPDCDEDGLRALIADMLVSVAV